MELEGRLNPALSIPEVLQFLGMNRMTGMLTVNHGDQTVRVTVRKGRIINASTLSRTRQLGAILLSRNLIERSKLAEALEHQKSLDPPPMLGQILLERRLVGRDDLADAVRSQLEEDIWELFAVGEGTFKFEHGTDDSVGEPAAELEIEPLVIEGTRRLDEWARISRNIPSDLLIPTITPVGDRTELELDNISHAEWRVLSLINGFYDIASIAARSGVGRFETFRIINSFLVSGQVALLSVEVPAKPPADAQLDDLAPPRAAVDPTPEPPDSSNSSTRLRAIFSRIRSDSDVAPEAAEAQGPAKVEDLTFANPVACAADMANRIVAQLVATPDFYVGPADKRLAEQYWRTIVMTHPRADLVVARGITLDTGRFDRFVEFSQAEAALRPCYLETVEAIGRYLRTVYLLAGQRLGARKAQEVFSQAIHQYSSRSQINYMGGVNFRDFAAKVVA